ncbi:MAG: hypothetical protein ACR2K9_06325 [Solirubrobacteraceae bacterium]
MSDEEQQIRTLIEQWAAAVHGGDMDRVLADHAGDIGLRREQGRWVVAHEHHSFPDDT